MKLRWKHFLLLVTASLIPLMAVTWISQNASRRLGKTISERAEKTLLDSVTKEMVSATRSYAAISFIGGMTCEQGIQRLAARAELALALPPLQDFNPYFATDFDDPKSAPKDMAPSRNHPVHSKDGSITYKPVSREHPNFLIAPGTDKNAVGQRVGQLIRLSSTLKEIGRDFEQGLYWAYASLEQGLHIAYPGHGGYPGDYDPRKRSWYQMAKKSHGITWFPIIDATTGHPMLTLSMPFRYPDGSFAGVVGMDIQITQALAKSETDARWSDKMVSFLVGTEVDPDSGQENIWVLSSPDMLSGDSKEIHLEMAAQQPEIEKMLHSIKNKQSGYIYMPYKGVDSLWAYATMLGNQYFVIVVPKSEIMALPKEVSRMVEDYSTDQAASIGAAALVALCCIGIVAFFTSRHSTRHILTVVDAWKRIAKGDYTVRLKTHMHDERDQLVHAFNDIVPKIDEHMRMRTALGLAQEVQQSLLPQSDPKLPGFDIAGTSIYCDETGGDYFDFIDTVNGGQKGLSVVVGDVSGHGVSSALLMATARALVMLRSSMPGEAANIISDVNRYLSRDTSHTGDFMTFFYCELQERKKEIRWVRAGHDPALIYDPATDAFDELKGKGPALGLDYSFEYDSFSRNIEQGQIIVMGTDGIWEMHNAQGHLFGKDALMDIIRNHQGQSARQIVDTVTKTLEQFRGDTPSQDDITLVVMKVE